MIRKLLVVAILLTASATVCSAAYQEIKMEPFIISFDIQGDSMTVSEEGWTTEPVGSTGMFYSLPIQDKDGLNRITIDIRVSSSGIYQYGSIKGELTGFSDVQEYSRVIDGQPASVATGLHPNGVNKWTVFSYEPNFTDLIVVYSTLPNSEVGDLMNTLHIGRMDAIFEDNATNEIRVDEGIQDLSDEYPSVSETVVLDATQTSQSNEYNLSNRNILNDDLDYWIQDLKDTNPSVREAAVLALKDFNDTRMVEPLILALSDNSGSIRKNAAQILGRLNDTRAVEPLIKVLKENNDSEVTVEAIKSLALLNDMIAVDPILKALSDSDDLIRAESATALGKLNDTKALGPLIQALKDKNDKVSAAAAASLGELNDTRAADPLLQLYSDTHLCSAAISLGKLQDRRVVGQLIQQLKKKNQCAAMVLGNFSDSRIVEPLIDAVKNDSRGDSSAYWLASRAAESLGNTKDERAVEPLVNFALSYRLSEFRTPFEIVIGALKKINSTRTIEYIVDSRLNLDNYEEEAAIFLLQGLNDSRATDLIIHKLDSDNPKTRSIAVNSLGDLGDSKAIEPLMKIYNGNGDIWERDLAWGALKKLGVNVKYPQ